MRGVEEATINIMMRWEETTHYHQVSSPDHSLMCGHPQCPQISDLTAAFCSTALQCGLQPASLPHCNYLNLHHASVYQNYTFLKLDVFFYGHMRRYLVKPKPYSISDWCQGSGCGQGRLSWTEEGFPWDFPVSSASGLPRMIPSTPETTFKLQINFVFVSSFML